MGVESNVDGHVLQIKVRGRFDFNMHQEFRQAIDRVEAGISKIEVDLSNTDYLDSSALGMLLLLRDKMSGDRSAVSIKGAAKDVKKILEIANFDKLFTLA